MTTRSGRNQTLGMLCILSLSLYRLAVPTSSSSYLAEGFTALPNSPFRTVAKRTNSFVITSALSGSSSDEGGAAAIASFVKSLDSALGNPTSATDAVVKSTTDSVTKSAPDTVTKPATDSLIQTVTDIVSQIAEDSSIDADVSSSKASAVVGAVLNSVDGSALQADSPVTASIMDNGQAGVSMAISNEAILVGGGAFALALAGVALALSQKDNTAQDAPEPSMAPGQREDLVERLEGGIQSKNEEESAPETAIRVFDESEEASKDLLDETKEALDDSIDEEIPTTNIGPLSSADLFMSNEEAFSSDDSPKPNEKSLTPSNAQLEPNLNAEIEKDALAEEKAKRKEAEQKGLWIQSLANTLSAKLRSTSEELETSTQMLEQTKLSLTEQMESNTILKAKYEEEKNALSRTSEQLAAAVETNQLLEDQYELEQNRLESTKRALDTAQEDLNETQRKLKKTSTELTDTKTQLQLTRGRLTETSTSLETMEKEQQSVRTLGRKIWQLSKTRLQKRARLVKDRFRRNNPNKD